MSLSLKQNVSNTFSSGIQWPISSGGHTMVVGVARMENERRRHSTASGKAGQTWGPQATRFHHHGLYAHRFSLEPPLDSLALLSSRCRVEHWPRPLVEFCVLWDMSLMPPGFRLEPGCGEPLRNLVRLLRNDCQPQVRAPAVTRGGNEPEITKPVGPTLCVLCGQGVGRPPAAAGMLGHRGLPGLSTAFPGPLLSHLWRGDGIDFTFPVCF